MKTVPPYTIFPEIYDLCMNPVPYHRWARYLLRRAAAHFDFKPRAVLDLACGTGMILAEMEGRVGELHGTDRSLEMLELARSRVPSGAFVQAAMEGPLPYDPERFAWAISTHDSVNYLTDKSDLDRHFAAVARVLVPGGLYSLDVVSLSNILANFHHKQLEERVGGTHLVWTNDYDSGTRVMESRLTFRPRRGEALQEIHLQRFYDTDELESMAGRHGLVLKWAEGDYSEGRMLGDDDMRNYHFYKS